MSMEVLRSEAEGKEEGEKSQEVVGWKSLLSSSTVVDLVKESHPKALVIIPHTATLLEAIDILTEKGILSAPVMDESSHVMHGIIDSLDIMTYVVTHWRKDSAKFEVGSFPSSDFFRHPITQVINFSKLDFPRVIPDVASVQELIELFLNPVPPGIVHRVVVLHGINHMKYIVSQSDIVHFVYKHIDLLQGDETVEQLGLFHAVVSSRADSPASRVLELMCDHRISGVALINQKGHVVGSVSSTDFRGLKPTSVDYFLMSALDFSQKGGNVKAPVVCHLDTTFRELLVLILKNKVHRIFVVDKSDILIGVVTLTDIIRHINSLS